MGPGNSLVGNLDYYSTYTKKRITDGTGLREDVDFNGLTLNKSFPEVHTLHSFIIPTNRMSIGPYPFMYLGAIKQNTVDGFGKHAITVAGEVQSRGNAKAWWNYIDTP